jgi:hypothetical protein
VDCCVSCYLILWYLPLISAGMEFTSWLLQGLLTAHCCQLYPSNISPRVWISWWQSIPLVCSRQDTARKILELFSARALFWLFHSYLNCAPETPSRTTVWQLRTVLSDQKYSQCVFSYTNITLHIYCQQEEETWSCKAQCWGEPGVRFRTCSILIPWKYMRPPPLKCLLGSLYIFASLP